MPSLIGIFLDAAKFLIYESDMNYMILSLVKADIEVDEILSVFLTAESEWHIDWFLWGLHLNHYNIFNVVWLTIGINCKLIPMTPQ